MKNDLFLDKEQRESAKSILSGVGILCAVATVLVFSALFFADVTFSAAATLELSLDFVLLFFSSYVMYFSLFDTGAERAALLPAVEALTKERARLFERYRTDGSYEGLQSFCRALSKSKSRERHEALLDAALLNDEELKALREKPRSARSMRERRILWRFAHERAVRITPSMLLAERGTQESVSPLALSPDRMRRRRFLRFLLPTALTALFSVSLAYEIAVNPSPDVIVGYLLKLFTLLFNGVKGFRAGYAHVESDRAAYMREQCFWLEEYFSTLLPKSEA